MNVVNHQKELDKIIGVIKQPTKLLLHSCCAPCSSYCMEYLREYFDITVFYYNPNISSEPEYVKRLEEEKRLIEEYNKQVDDFKICHATDSSINEKMYGDMRVTCNTKKINIIEGDYIPSEFYNQVKGYEQCKEGGERCFRCFELRLLKSFEAAKEIEADYVTTTLTISPLKNAAKINEIGYACEKEDGPKWLPSDFKKRNGYKRSIELSHTYDLYRQNFCGCVYSRQDTKENQE